MKLCENYALGRDTRCTNIATKLHTGPRWPAMHNVCDQCASKINVFEETHKFPLTQFSKL